MTFEGEPLSVLIVTTRETARSNGCTWGSCRHKDKPNLQFWWSGLAREILAGRRFDVVAITTPLADELRSWLIAHLVRDGTLLFEGQLLGRRHGQAQDADRHRH